MQRVGLGFFLGGGVKYRLGAYIPPPPPPPPKKKEMDSIYRYQGKKCNNHDNTTSIQNNITYNIR